jgi:hypothetical protein
MNLLKLTFFTLLVAFLFSCSKINSVSIDSPPESVFKGTSVQLKAIVKGEGSPDTTLNWVIVEPVEKGTSITKEGLLTISTDETAKYVTIKAITVGDTSKYAVSNIKLILDPKLFYGKWECKRDNLIQKITIDSSTWYSNYSNGNSYRIEKLEWTPIYNEDAGTSKSYPEGYIIVGKANGISRPSKDFSNGQVNTFQLFINKEKKTFYRIVDGQPENKYYYDKVN